MDKKKKENLPKLKLPNKTPSLTTNSLMSSCFEVTMTITFLTILTGLNLQVPLTLLIPTLFIPKLTSKNDEWKIEYQRAIKKLRTDHPEWQYDYYIDNHNISRPHGYIPVCSLPLAANIPTIAAVTPAVTGLKL